ncbi:TPA: hypothetical protein ACWLUJ_005770 [Pseudomonas aeruginosa]|nr:hypothetical protein [Pseudomonas aeruginosa]EIU2864579.1 hypothetical protein [Pseudomonas aeruginosa]HEJ2342253.1 hypothetical protein [Pseudomonas aeruginosa]HEK3716915.1 hypothetical protein [Pseudomonas aeruginosa]
MSLTRGKVAEMLWWAGMALSLFGILLMVAQVNFAAVPVGQHWPVYTLIFGALLVAFAKLVEWHTRFSAWRVVSAALSKANDTSPR